MGILDRYLNGSSVDAVSFPVVDTSSPIQWAGLAAALGASIAAAVTRGILAIPAAIAEAISGLIAGLGTFISGRAFFGDDILAAPIRSSNVIDTVFGGLQMAVEQFWAFNVGQFGAFAAPAAIGISLASLWILNVGLSEALDQLGGGD